MAITYPASTRFTTGEMYWKSTDSDNIHIIASMSASSVKGYDYKVVARGKSNTNYEYWWVARTTINMAEIADIASELVKKRMHQGSSRNHRLYLWRSLILLPRTVPRFLHQSPTQVATQTSVLVVPAAGSLEMAPLLCYWLVRG